ncbi:MAG: hypothetical protein K2H33_09175 [Muribaculaceae bacterium]|nr:hypothetical protein [Muribaculaceae bacterium]
MRIVELIGRWASKISPRLFLAGAYIHNRKRIPNFKSPKDLSEIWISKVLTGDFNKIYYLADKYQVREYIEQKGLGRYLPALIGVYDSADSVDFEQMPPKYALKMNFGCGMNLICQDSNTFDKRAALEKLRLWFERKGKYSLVEEHYNLIEPKAICEEFIDDGNGGFPTDYKFMCINGKAFCVLVCSERSSGHVNKAMFNMEWDFLKEYDKSGEAHPFPKPANFDEMVAVVEKLAENIELVRVDLYSDGKKIWIGEITLTPAGCIFHKWTQKALDEMGRFYYQTKKNRNV